MGHGKGVSMGNCSGKCDNCNDKITISKKIYETRIKDIGGYDLLHPPKETKPKLKSLDGICEHYYYSKISSYQCMNCIREWVNIVSIDEANKMAIELENSGKKVASNRIREAIKEKIWKERL